MRNWWRAYWPFVMYLAYLVVILGFIVLFAWGVG